MNEQVFTIDTAALPEGPGEGERRDTLLKDYGWRLVELQRQVENRDATIADLRERLTVQTNRLANRDRTILELRQKDEFQHQSIRELWPRLSAIEAAAKEMLEAELPRRGDCAEIPGWVVDRFRRVLEQAPSLPVATPGLAPSSDRERRLVSSDREVAAWLAAPVWCDKAVAMIGRFREALDAYPTEVQP